MKHKIWFTGIFSTFSVAALLHNIIYEEERENYTEWKKNLIFIKLLHMVWLYKGFYYFRTYEKK
jgi:hypothetical protein